MVRQTASTIILEILGGAILLILVAVGLLAFRLSSGPLELSYFEDNIEQALTDARGGRDVEVGQVFLEWSPSERRAMVTASDLVLKDDVNVTSAEASTAEIVLSASSLIMGKVEVLRLDLATGWVNVDQVSSTVWSVAGSPLPPIPEGELPQTAGEWLERANQVLPQVLDALATAESSLSVERLSFDDFEIRVKDKGNTEIVTLREAKGRLERAGGDNPDGLVLALSGTGIGQGWPLGIAIDLTTSESNQRLGAQFAVADWPLAELARRLGVDPEGISGLPANSNINFDVTRDGGVQQVTLRADAGAGTLPLGAQGFDLDDLNAIVTYRAGDDSLALDLTTTKAGRISGGALITLSDALLGMGARDVTLQSDRLVIDQTPRFSQPLTFERTQMNGSVVLQDRALDIATLTTRVRETDFTVAGQLSPMTDRDAADPPFLANLTASVEGEVDKETLLYFWPETLGEGARRFVDQRLLQATVSDIQATLILDRGAIIDGRRLKDENLDVTFSLRDGGVRFMDDLPPVQNAVARGRLTGNTFKVTIDSATWSDWSLNDGVVDFPAFNPRGEDFRIFAMGRGPAESVLTALVNSRLKIDFDPNRIAGEADVTFEMFRPALDNVGPDRVRYEALGTIRDAGLTTAALGLDVTKGQVQVNVDQDGMTLKGFGDLGPSPVQFTYRDGFRDGNSPSDLSASAVVTPEVLNRFGLLGRAYLTGEIPVEVQAKLTGEVLQTAAMAFDLEGARVDLSEIGWVKPKDTPGRASVVYDLAGQGRKFSLVFDADGAYLEGDIEVGEGSRLQKATLAKAYLKDAADVSGSVVRTAEGGLDFVLAGPYLDVSGAMPEIGAAGTSDTKNETPISLTAEVDVLRLRPGLDMGEAKLSFNTNAAGLEAFDASGKSADGSPLSAQYRANGDAAPTIRVQSGNAGFLTYAFLDIDFMEGGDLDLTGTLAHDGAPARFNIAMTNTRLINAPFLTQILSLASLRGLADTLGGEGVLFSRIDVPLVLADGRYIVEGATAQGPALGLTAKGSYQSDGGAVDFDGVLVPSFGLNSALGGIPIIGDLVVGRDGEGVFSLTYSVRGTLEKANVGVNPLSALAPGVIRRIFENPSDTSIPEAEARPDDVPIPSELPPIPDEEF